MVGAEVKGSGHTMKRGLGVPPSQSQAPAGTQRLWHHYHCRLHLPMESGSGSAERQATSRPYPLGMEVGEEVVAVKGIGHTTRKDSGVHPNQSLAPAEMKLRLANGMLSCLAILAARSRSRGGRWV